MRVVFHFASSQEVIAPTGARHVYQVVNSSKTQITVMVCFKALGLYLPPMIIYPGERFIETGIEDFPEALYGHSSNGWMDSSLFVEFLRHFTHTLKDNNIPTPVLLFADGHSTHISLEAATYCSENGIILYCLLANAMHIMQPCDVRFFSPMKSSWKRQVKLCQIRNLGQNLTKRNFASVFKEAWGAVTVLETAVHAFRSAGLFPLDPNGIDKSKLGPAGAATLLNQSSSVIPQNVTQHGETSDGFPITTARRPVLLEQTSLANQTSVSEPVEMDMEAPVLVNIETVVVEENTNIQAVQAEMTAEPFAAVATVEAQLRAEPITATVPALTAEPIGAVPAQMTAELTTAVPAVTAQMTAELITSVPAVTTLSPVAASGVSVAPLSIRVDTCNLSKVVSPTPMRSHAVVRRDPRFVSSAFSTLYVPEMKKKKTVKLINEKLPKAISGKDALVMLRERQQKKIADELAKLKRKEERERKKQVKTEESERKAKERGEKKRKREQAKALKKLVSKRKKRNVSTSSSSDNENIRVEFEDTDDDFPDDTKMCPGCRTDDGDPVELIKCQQCQNV